MERVATTIFSATQHYNIVATLFRMLATLETLRSNDADGNEDVYKTMGSINKTTTLHVYHAFLHIYLPVFARLRRENA